MSQLFDTVKALCAVPGPAGDEALVAKAIIELITPYADEVRTTPLGSVIAFKKGKQPPKNKLMFDAHMDEVGFIITAIEGNGMLRFGTLGGIDPRVTLGKRLLVGPNLLPGVVGGKPIGESDGEDVKNPGKTDSLYIDIGAKDGDEAKKYVRLGDTAIFDSEFVEFGDGFVKARALDDRGGCAMLVQMLRSELPYDAWFSFSVMEETGGAGARTNAFAIDPDYAVVVEDTTAADVGGVAKEKQVCRCRKGPTLSFMDRSTIYPPALYRDAMAYLQDKGLTVQTKEGVFGGNNAGSIHPSRAGIPCLAVSIPTRYIHSGSSVIHREDLDHTFGVLMALCEYLGNR